MNTARKMTKASWIVRAIAALGVFLVIFACNSPFIPIPPPNPNFEPVEVPDGVGGLREDWRVTGPPDSRAIGAKVFIFNSSVGQGIILRTSSDGSYAAYPFLGQRGDRVELHWERGPEDRSLTICRTLNPGTATVPCP